MSVPLVSIVMPTYNSEQYAAEAIDSVIAQTFTDWELLVVDDCSADKTVEILEGYERSDNRIRVHRLMDNGGPAKARNVAIGAARGRYIAFIDSDDLWFEDKLESQLRLFGETKAPLLYSAYEKIDEFGCKQGRVVEVPESIDYSGLLNATVIATVTAIYDTERVGRVLMPDIRKRQDYGLWLKILRRGGQARAVTRPLAYLRKRRDSVSSNKLSAAAYVWKVYRELEQLSLPASLYHFGHYAARAFLKSRI